MLGVKFICFGCWLRCDVGSSGETVNDSISGRCLTAHGAPCTSTWCPLVSPDSLLAGALPPGTPLHPGALPPAPAEQPLSHTPALISFSMTHPHPLCVDLCISHKHSYCIFIHTSKAGNVCNCALIHLSVAINILRLSRTMSDHPRLLVITNHYRL